jgi:hypothetical protein
MKKISTFICGMLFYSVLFANTRVVDLTTGYDNASSSFIPFNGSTPDDQWTVKIPGGSTFINAYAASYSSWATTPNARWISPGVSSSGTALAIWNGVYTYKLTFTASTCSVQSATLLLNNFGGDNAVTSIQVNSHNYPLSAGFTSFSATSLSVGADIIPGTNTITVTVRNDLDINNYMTVSGLLIDGNLTIDYWDPTLIPTITGNNTFCSGPIALSGSDGPGMALNHYWEILESDQYGNVISGGYSWYGWTAGSPTTFNHPNPSSIPCNKYYRIKLALSNACFAWVETTMVIRINCNPTADAGSDIYLCSPGCVTIGGGGRTQNNVSFSWSPSGSTVSGHPQQTIVCPTVTTTYTVTATNTITGCTSTDIVTVNIVECKNLQTENGYNKITEDQSNYMRLLDNNNQQNSLLVFPNPSQGEFVIQLNQEISGDIEIYNILGNKIYSLRKENDNIRYTVDLTGYPAGIYTICFTVNDEQKVQKIILQ